MTPTTSTHGPESDDGRQGAPGATDTATEARETFALRVTRGPYAGDIITLGPDRTRESADQIRRQMATPTEVVELDEHGNVAESTQHTFDFGEDA